MGRQFVVQLENRPGALSHLARVLATRGVDIWPTATIGAVGTGRRKSGPDSGPDPEVHVVVQDPVCTAALAKRPGAVT